MFFRKMLSSNRKLVWVFIDLLIVIVGVYCAFLIQNYAEDNKNNKERARLLSAVKIELEVFRYRMYQTSLGMTAETARLREVQSKNAYINFLDYRYIEPQYDYQTIQYALNLQNSEIVDFDLYNALQSIYVEVKKIEHVERLLTATSRKYRSIPTNFEKESASYKLLDTENRDNFVRFITLIQDRAESSGRIAAASVKVLPMINEFLGEKTAKAVEREIIINNLNLVKSEDEAVSLGKQLFPKFTEEEIRAIYKEGKKQ